MNRLRLTLGLIGLCLVMGARSAHAFTIETSFTAGCHEQVTEDVLRNVRAANPQLAVPLATSRDDRALMDDVAFTIPGDLHDFGAVALVLGVRDNDVKSFGAEALDQLAALNADPNAQMLHCLRSADQDEPTGSSAAVADCRAFIKENLLAALDGLDAAGLPDGAKRDQLTVTLAIRGKITVSVPTFYLRAGRALHTIEDSFTHTYRNVNDRHKITVVLNWIDYANKTLDESRDGPPHKTELDRCDDPDALRAERRQLAIEAGTAALSVLVDPTTDRAGKERGIDAMLDKYISFDSAANCTADNNWCSAPENSYANASCGCRTAGGGADGGVAAPSLAFGVLALAVVARRRRQRLQLVARTRRWSRAAHWVAVLPLCVVFLAPNSAHAEAPARAANGVNTGEGPIKALEGKSNSGAANTVDPPGAIFGRISVGASYDKPGLVGGLGLRYQFSRPLMFGFDAEVNPFITTTPAKVRTGVLNTYVSVIRRFQLKNDSLNVRSQIGLGASVLLIDLVGAPAGSYGPYFGLSFLGVEWKVTRGFYLTIDPTYIALPVPHVTGAPFGYLQYRFLVGLEFGG